MAERPVPVICGPCGLIEREALQRRALRVIGSSWKSMRGKNNAQETPGQEIKPPSVFL